MKSKKVVRVLFPGLISLLCIAYIALGDSEISEAQKKETVYRMSAGYEKDFPTVKEISPQQAMKLLDQGTMVFVDTRNKF